MVDASDPCHGVFSEVKNWLDHIDAAPSFEEIREVEYVRQSGEINMITAGRNLQRHCFDRGLYHAVCWLERCKENKTYWGTLYSETVKQFEEAHGPRDKWITKEFKHKVDRNALEIEERNLKIKLQELKNKREKLSPT